VLPVAAEILDKFGASVIAPGEKGVSEDDNGKFAEVKIKFVFDESLK
jgi:hypothetical protein